MHRWEKFKTGAGAQAKRDTVKARQKKEEGGFICEEFDAN